MMRPEAGGNFRFIYPAKKDHEPYGVVVVEPKVFTDNRGFFSETFNSVHMVASGIPEVFKQDNHSFSKKGVIRGLHIQTSSPQGKLVRCIRGSIYDVAVDVRKDSKTFGCWFGTELSQKNGYMMYIPEGFAHGFMALEDSDVLYKCTEVWQPQSDRTILYDDPAIKINWLKMARDHNIEEFIVSQKDISSAISIELFAQRHL